MGLMCRSRPLPPALTALTCPILPPARLARGSEGGRCSGPQARDVPRGCAPVRELAWGCGQGGVSGRRGFGGLAWHPLSALKGRRAARFCADFGTTMAKYRWVWWMENLSQPTNGAFPGGYHKPPVSGGSHTMPWIWLRQVRGSASPWERQSRGREHESCGGQQHCGPWARRIPVMDAQSHHCLGFITKSLVRRGLHMAAHGRVGQFCAILVDVP